MLAHELRNPLGAISSAVELIKLSDDTERRGFATAAIERQTKQLSRIIEDVLDMTRINLGQI